MPIKFTLGKVIEPYSSECYNEIINYLKEIGVSPYYIETNVLYRGSELIKKVILKQQKLTVLHNSIIIADGDIGTEYDEIVINKEYIKKCKIGKGYGRFKQFIVMSHFKGHGEAGFGGAIKQLGMGFAARGGKLEQHSGISPVIDQDKCISCGLCAKKCDFDAIEILDTAVIDENKCSGCAGCIAVCPEGAIRNVWGGSHFREKLAEYAYGASKDKDIIYISFVHNITAHCDCTGKPMKPITQNIGVLAAKDPVAIDTACLDLVQKNSETLIKEERSLGMGENRARKMEYELIEI